MQGPKIRTKILIREHFVAQGYGDAAEGGLGSLEQRGMGVGKMQAAMEAHNSAEECLEEPVMVLSYSEERARRVLYQDKELQLLVRAIL